MNFFGSAKVRGRHCCSCGGGCCHCRRGGLASAVVNALNGQWFSERCVSARILNPFPALAIPPCNMSSSKILKMLKKLQQAREVGTSAVPTINRGSFVGSIDTFGQLPAALPNVPLIPSHCRRQIPRAAR